MAPKVQSVELDPEVMSYTRAQTIAAFDAWANRGERLFAIDATIAAVHWLAHSTPPKGEERQRFDETLNELREWLNDTRPLLPDRLGEDALYWLRATKPARDRGAR